MKKATIFALALVVALSLFATMNGAAQCATVSTCPATTSAQCTSCDTSACCCCPSPVTCPTTACPAAISSVVTCCDQDDSQPHRIFDPYNTPL